jgi:hypothetical protein
MIRTKLLLNYLLLVWTKCCTTADMLTITFEMNDSKNGSVHLFSLFRENVLLLEMSRRSHQKCMMLINVLSNHVEQFFRISYNKKFIKNHIWNEWFQLTFCSIICILWTKCCAIRGLMGITLDINDSNHSSIQLFASLLENVLLLGICRKSD